ncbi:MAG: DUF1206 domain-containing protein [Oligoflexia bacterium]|nr:DUF1206 domain-containing protein [Oligoflexia bacterium]
MLRSCRLFLIYVIYGLLSGGLAWGADAGKPDLSGLLARLGESKAGAALLADARKFWSDDDPKQPLAAHFRWGSVSRTDAVLIREFDPATDQESRRRDVVVYVRENQPQEDLLLDIAHELVHATTRPDWDPYDPQLTAGRYIENAIEGPGGEVEAVRRECQVGLELSLRAAERRCGGYLSSSADEASKRERIKRDFYRVGRWRSQIAKQLGEDAKLFPELSSKAVVLYSSTGHAPYPVALMNEFSALNRIACENMRKRQQASEASRSPASDRIQRFLSMRCGD